MLGVFDLTDCLFDPTTLSTELFGFAPPAAYNLILRVELLAEALESS